MPILTVSLISGSERGETQERIDIDTTTILVMTLLIMIIIIILNTGDFTYNRLYL
jgi:hypothetical protein